MAGIRPPALVLTDGATPLLPVVEGILAGSQRDPAGMPEPATVVPASETGVTLGVGAWRGRRVRLGNRSRDPA